MSAPPRTIRVATLVRLGIVAVHTAFAVSWVDNAELLCKPQ